jgi:hypothetical protein
MRRIENCTRTRYTDALRIDTKDDMHDYQDFELTIRASRAGVCQVTLRSSVATAVTTRLELDGASAEIQALLNKLQPGMDVFRRSESAPMAAARTLGQKLFTALFNADLLPQYDQARGQVFRDGRRGLRIMLRIEAAELAVLPWELLHDPRDEQFLAIHPFTPVVRIAPLPPHPLMPDTAVGLPLRILAVTASPRGLAPLDLGRELDQLRRTLTAQAGIEVEVLEGCTQQRLRDSLLPGGPEWDVLSFMGHGGFDSTKQEAYLSLEDERGDEDCCSGDKFASLLVGHHSLRLVLLNACEGARGNAHEKLSSIAETLVQRVVPNVIAMQYAITDRAALDFARTFYSLLVTGKPIELALTEARATTYRSEHYWPLFAAPVFYTRQPEKASPDDIPTSAGKASKPGPTMEASPSSASEFAKAETSDAPIPDVVNTPAENVLHTRAGQILTTPAEAVQPAGEQRPKSRGLAWFLGAFAFALALYGLSTRFALPAGNQPPAKPGSAFTDSEQAKIYQSGRLALERGGWEPARELFRAVVPYSDSLTLIKESYYGEAQQHIGEQRWDAAAIALLLLEREDPAYRDAAELPTRYPQLDDALAALRWQTGKVQLAGASMVQFPQSRSVPSYTCEATILAAQTDRQEGWASVIGLGETVNTITMFNLRDGSTTTQDYHNIGSISLLDLDQRSGNVLVAGWYNKELVRLLLLRHDGTVGWELRHTHPLRLGAFTADGSGIVTLDDTGLRYWSAADGSQRSETPVVNAKPVLAVSPDNQFVAVADSAVRVFQYGSAEPSMTLSPIKDEIRQLVFSSDSTLLAAAALDEVVIWRVADGAEVLRFTPNRMVDSIALSPDNRLALTEDGALRRLSDGALLQTFESRSGAWWCATFDPDGSRMYLIRNVSDREREVNMYAPVLQPDAAEQLPPVIPTFVPEPARPTVPPSPQAAPKPTQQSARVTYNSAGEVRVRAEPARDAAILGELAEGTAVVILAQREVAGERWYEIQSGNLKGWAIGTRLEIE